MKDSFARVEDFVRKCPLLAAFGVVFVNGAVGVIPVALEYEGSSDVDMGFDVAGNGHVMRHKIFKLVSRDEDAEINENFQRFVLEFEHWVDYAHFNGLTTEVSEDAEARVWADSQRVETQNGSRHAIFLHIIEDVAYPINGLKFT